MKNTHQHTTNANQTKAKSTTFFSPSFIQPKLTIGQPNDKYEQEADAMADKVMRMPQNTPAVQMKCAGCEQEEKVQPKRKGNFLSLKRLIQKMSSPEEELQTKPMVQRMGNPEEEKLQTKPLMMKSEGGGGVATSALTSQLNSSKGGGSPLPASTNQFMSNAFGSDFSGVRVHTGSNAIQMNQGLGARAFAHGSDLYFNKGEYSPGSSDGKRLLGHELTHVVQQGSSSEARTKIQRTIGDEHDLTSLRFKGDLALEAVFDNEKFIRKGSTGGNVIKLQQSLIDIGYQLPKFGADGSFGNETLNAVKEFQTEFELGVDGIVGSKTLGTLDEIFSSEGKEEQVIDNDTDEAEVADGDFPPSPTLPVGDDSINQLLSEGGFSDSEGIIQTNRSTVPPPKTVKPPFIKKVLINLTNQDLKILWSNGKTRGPYHISSGTGCPNTKSNPCIKPRKGDNNTYCTPVGTFNVDGLGGEFYQSSKGDPMAWYVAFVLGRGIGTHHSKTVTGTPKSHGCVRLYLSVAKLIHNNVNNKSKVVVSGKAATRKFKMSKAKAKKGYPGCPGTRA